MKKIQATPLLYDIDYIYGPQKHLNLGLITQKGVNLYEYPTLNRALIGQHLVVITLSSFQWNSDNNFNKLLLSKNVVRIKNSTVYVFIYYIYIYILICNVLLDTLVKDFTVEEFLLGNVLDFSYYSSVSRLL